VTDTNPLASGSKGLAVAVLSVAGYGVGFLAATLAEIVPAPYAGVAYVVAGIGSIGGFLGMLWLGVGLFRATPASVAMALLASDEPVEIKRTSGLFRAIGRHELFVPVSSPPTLYLDDGLCAKWPAFGRYEEWRARVLLGFIRTPSTRRRWILHAGFDLLCFSGIGLVWFIAKDVAS
jgi:hypothetical protein